MSRHALAAALGAAVLMPLGSCVGLEDVGDNDGPTRMTFRCDDDRSFVAMVSEDRRQAFVSTDDDTYELVLVDRDGDELEYANRDDVRMRVDGDDGRLRVPDGDDFEDCTT